MKLLLDTHFLIWLATEPHRLNPAERALTGNPSISIQVSVVSLWEVRIKWESLDRHGRRKGSIAPSDAIAFANENALTLVPLTPDMTILPLEIEVANADPLDRMILTQVQALGARLLTRDAKLRDHPLAFVP
ncbi:type II toxin-antitoxin system VapC family toxin [uncultured Sphingomonas sp.]|uniref:type II toxin-antitoxin system VapC family toxin n=1 Tax=uncultured Sphingomonas sp. TaxID=158754 RepID=UPI0035CC79AB